MKIRYEELNLWEEFEVLHPSPKCCNIMLQHRSSARIQQCRQRAICCNIMLQHSRGGLQHLKRRIKAVFGGQLRYFEFGYLFGRDLGRELRPNPRDASLGLCGFPSPIKEARKGAQGIDFLPLTKRSRQGEPGAQIWGRRRRDRNWRRAFSYRQDVL